MRRPHRRSRKIGLTQGGRVTDGRAYEKWSRVFSRDLWTRLSDDSSLHWAVLRENPSRDYFHPCGAQSIHGVLERLPEDLTEDLRAVVLRRMPQDDAEHGVEARRRFACIILNPFPKDLRVVWDAKPSRRTIRHNRPWCDRWTREGEEWVLTWTRREVRRYYLYHLLLHELGHLNEPWTYRGRKAEDFAENFALEWARRLGEIG